MSKRAKSLLIVLAFVAGLSYFAFTLVLFDPFEGSFMDEHEGAPIAIEYVVPMNVDFLVHKRGLADDVDPFAFPVAKIWDEIRYRRRWQEFAKSPLHDELAERTALAEKVEVIRAASKKIPLVDPVEDVLGRDAALFGRLESEAWPETEAALVFLGSATAKLAYEAAGNSLVRSLLGLSIEVTTDDAGVRRMELPDGTVLYAHRDRDLFVVGTGPGLVKESIDLLRLGREKSLGFTRRYHSTVAQDVAEFAGFKPMQETQPADLQKRVQLHVNLPALLERAGFDEAFLEPRGEATRWIAAKMFNPRYFRTLTLDLGIADTLDVRGMLTFDKRRAQETESGFYDRRTFHLKQVMDRVASLVPEKTFFLMAARVDMANFLPMLLKALGETNPDARKLMDDLVATIKQRRPDFRANNAADAAVQIASFLGQDVVLAVQRDTYYGAPEDPTPLVAVFFQVTERGPTYERLEAAAGDPNVATGYQGFVYPISKASAHLRGGEAGVATWYNVWHFPKGSADERWMQDVLLAGTGVRNVSFGIIDPRSKDKGPWTLAVVLSPRVETLEVAGGADGEAREQEFGTAYEFLSDVVHLSRSPSGATEVKDNFRGGSRTVRALSTSEKYRQGAAFLDGFANVGVYLDAAGWKDVLLDQAQERATEATRPDWVAAREDFAEELLAGEFATWKGKAMPPDVETAFERRIDERIDVLDRTWRMDEIPRARRAFEQNLAWIDLLQDAFLAARIDEASEQIELRARIRTRLDE